MSIENRPLTLLERSQEILGFAEKYLNIVFRGTAYEGEDYAITSHLRPNHHEGVGTIPHMVSWRLEDVKERLDGGAEGDNREYIVANFERCAAHLKMAQNFLESSKYPTENEGHLLRCLRENVPGIEKTLGTLRAAPKSTV